jgi:hypothetical protein
VAVCCAATNAHGTHTLRILTANFEVLPIEYISSEKVIA